jgi:DNA helicase-2/ATP-dependent DNA helicase PcrA
MDDLLKGLNPQQQQAVTASDGPVLVLAGPGSGKTRVLTRRVAWLVSKRDVAPWRIMAVTFTNKAAREMRERLEKLLDPSRARSLTLGTFHATCARILRREAEAAGIPRDYAIFDADDQLRLVKQAIKDLNLDDKRYGPQGVRGAISRAKNELVPPEAYDTGSYYGEVVKRIYERYQALLATNAGLDFDDLLMVTVRLFSRSPDVRAVYQERYRHILVDEFQDTNQAQYALLQQLAGQHHNLFCVADEDQCLPSGTAVAVPDGTRPVEEIREGNIVLAAAGRCATIPVAVKRVYRKPYSGKLVEICTLGGHVLRATPNHVLFARMGRPLDKYYVYLMYRHDKGYRIGTTVGARSDGTRKYRVSGLSVRGNQENADKIWVLKVCDTKDEAIYHEQFFAYEYGIPTMVFHTTGRRMRFTQEHIDRLYDSIDTHKRATRLMEELYLHPGFPHHRPRGIAGDRAPQRVVVNLSLFGDIRCTSTSPWHAHRIALNTSDLSLKQRMVDEGYSVRRGRRNTWYIGTCRLSYEEALALTKALADAGGGLDTRQAAFLTNAKKPGGQTIKYDFHPAAHIHPSMLVAVLNDGNIVEDEVSKVTWSDYEGDIYDLDVDIVHNYVADGIVVHNSIYRWRGADYRNIRRLRNDHPDLLTILLEENYRSTQTILDAAQAVIRHNPDRTDKSLFTQRGRGPEIVIHEAYDQDEEAQFVVGTIAQLTAQSEVCPGECAVMYRTNAQSRALEDAFIRAGLPYKLVGATRFYARREIKDLIAFLRLIHNPADNISMARVINVPRRGVGQKTVAALGDAARKRGSSTYEVLKDTPDNVGARAQRALTGFLEMVEGWIAASEQLQVAQLIDRVLEDIAYADYLRDGTEEGEDRWANVLELRNVAADYEDLALTDFLADVALVSDVDDLSEEVDAPTLMTLHSAKGLEFPVVFITGLEDGMLPHSRSFDDAEQMAEERRLMYVGLTRAKDRLFLTRAFVRTHYGDSEPSAPSRFLDDIPAELVSGTRKPRRSRSASMTAWPSTSAPHPSEPQFRVGERVWHPTFGEGIVVECSPDRGGDHLTTVMFEDVGLKRLLASYAHLERLDS